MRRTDPTGRMGMLAALCVLAVGCQTSSQKLETTDAGQPELERAAASEVTKAILDEGLETVYFAHDVWLLDEQARETLRKNASRITAHPEWGRIRVEGHCDERGSEEYNFVLGERRATEVKNYLQDLGVPQTRLSTVSYGEANPAVRGGNENAWKWNRRSVLLQAENTASTPEEPSTGQTALR